MQSSHAARMTLRELERWIRWEVAGHYHQRVHAGLQRSQVAVWRRHEERLQLSATCGSAAVLSFLSARGQALPPAGRDPFLQHQLLVRYLAADVSQSKDKLLVKYDHRDRSGS